MGRNGKSPALFPVMINFINMNVGKEVIFTDITNGVKPGRNTPTCYVYNLMRLGYIEQCCGLTASDSRAKFKIIKPLARDYTSTIMKKELKDLKQDLF